MPRQFPGVRVPIPLVIFLCLAVIGGVWWHGTRGIDFMTPPSEAKLAMVRNKALASLPRADRQDELSLENDPTAVPAAGAMPPVGSGKPKPSANLREYADEAAKGAAHLSQVAAALEAKGEFQNALLAWERVLDSGNPDESQANTAISAIKHLRPTLPDWNTQAATGIAITLQAGTGQSTATVVEPILAATARDLERASAGILRVTSAVTAGKDSETSATNPAPVALWLTGPTKESPSTEVLSFTVGPPETLAEEIRKTVFQLIRSHIAALPGHSPLPAISAEGTATDALNSHITRFAWHELGTSLNLPLEKSK